MTSTLSEQVPTPINLTLAPSDREGVAYINLQDAWLDCDVPFEDEASLKAAFEIIKAALAKHGPENFISHLPPEWWE